MALGRRPRLGDRPLAREGPAHPYVKLWRPYSRYPTKLVILEPFGHGAISHWNGERSVPHHRRTRKCPGCKAQLPRLWYYYLSCLLLPQVERVILQLSECGFGSCPELSRAEGKLRGRVIQVARLKEGRRAAQVASMLPDLYTGAMLPPHQTPLALCTLWGLTPDEVLGIIERDESVDLDNLPGE